MNWASCFAGVLTALAASAHVTLGTREFARFAPTEENLLARQSWTQALAGWQWVSCDLILATLAFFAIGCSSSTENESIMLRIAAMYFAVTGLAWLMTIAIAGTPVKNRFIVLGQWLFCWLVSVVSWFASYNNG